MKLASFQKIIFYLSVFLLERKKKLKKTKIQSHFLAFSCLLQKKNVFLPQKYTNIKIIGGYEYGKTNKRNPNSNG